MKKISIRTSQKEELIDITEIIQEEIENVKIRDGLVFVFCLHTTAGIFITENEPGLKKDWLSFFKKITSGISYFHNHLDGNADSHIFGALIGQSQLLPVREKKLILGRWQRIFLIELDGPRKREIIIDFLKT